MVLDDDGDMANDFAYLDGILVFLLIIVRMADYSDDDDIKLTESVGHHEWPK